MDEYPESGSTPEVSLVGKSNYLLVQFFGIDEITDSFENKNLLVSQALKDKINEVDKDLTISCFFVLQDIRALVGYGEIVRNEALEVLMNLALSKHLNVFSPNAICPTSRMKLARSPTRSVFIGASL